MRGELQPSRDRREPETATGPGAGYDGAPGSQDGHLTDTASFSPFGPVNRRKLIFGVLFVVAALVGLYFLVPKLAGLNQTWGQLKHGNPLWLILGAGLECLSIAGYVVLFRTVFARGVPGSIGGLRWRSRWRGSPRSA